MAVKRTICFKDLDDQDVKQDWYFSLDKADIVEMDIIHEHSGSEEDVMKYLQSILKEKRSRELLDLWKELLFRAVGKRVGSLLVKDEEAVREFRYGGAYRQFFSEIIEMPDAGSAFFLSIMPTDVQAKVAEQQARLYSKDELLAMTDEEFAEVAGTDVTEMSKEHMQIAFLRKTSKAA